MPKQVWEAEDGTQFEDEEECKQYEYYLEEITKQLRDTGGYENAIELVFFNRIFLLGIIRFRQLRSVRY